MHLSLTSDMMMVSIKQTISEKEIMGNSVPQELKKIGEGWVDPMQLIPLLEETFALPGKMAPAYTLLQPS
jgi:hypothetical protein